MSPRWIGALAVVVTIAATLPVASADHPAAADPRADARRANAEAERASALLEGATDRARAAARRFAVVSAQLPAAQERVVAARGQVAAATAAANTAQRAAERAQEAVRTAHRAYEASVRRVEDARERVATFVSTTYKGGDLVSINVLLGSRTPQDIIQRTGYVDRVLSTERAAVDVLVAARGEAKQRENDAELARREAVAAQREAEAALGAARAAHAEAEGAAAALTALAGQRRAALTVARQERSASLARYRDAAAEAARIEAELRAWEARQRGQRNTPALRPGARLLMPVNGWKSSDFGMRFDPFFRVWQLHAGVDLAAGGGQPILAAADGRVVRAGYNGGYGNFTCIYHGQHAGSGLSTCYAHQSRIEVWPGQRVRRGQVIGRVGTTGASTGNHLHFEVRLDGRPSPPLAWLPACLC
jgi:murein DD-endopeptidase MepM/ murein hydrolase activator NlpD